MNKNLKAFTIVELMVVLGVVTAIAGLGIAGMIAFRRNVQLQEASSNFISTLRTVQNMARTGTLSRYTVDPSCSDSDDPLCRRPDGYALYFDSIENYSIRYCLETEFAGEPRLTCGVEDLNVKPREFSEIEVYPNQQTSSDCQGIFFKRLTGEISAISTDTLSPINNLGQCTIDIQLAGNFVGRHVVIDLPENNISQVTPQN